MLVKSTEIVLFFDFVKVSSAECKFTLNLKTKSTKTKYLSGVCYRTIDFRLIQNEDNITIHL